MPLEGSETSCKYYMDILSDFKYYEVWYGKHVSKQLLSHVLQLQSNSRILFEIVFLHLMNVQVTLLFSSVWVSTDS